MPPASVPAEALERTLPKLLIQPEPNNIVLSRESADRVAVASMWRYRLRACRDQLTNGRVFARYQSAVADAEDLASRRKARLFYLEDGATNLLMDYRPGGGP